MRIRLFCIALAGVLLLVAPALPVAGSEGGFVLWANTGSSGGSRCVTADCHAILGKAPYVHQPVVERDCRACHEPTAGAPHPGPMSMRLVEVEPELCLGCHDDPAAGLEHPHTAVVEGCTGCHSPHQGGLPKFVLQEGGRLCLACHDYVLEGEYVHGPVGAGKCDMCHKVHGSDNIAMLKLPENGLCLACHTQIREIMETAVSQHEPVAEGVCWDCHTPHASDYRPFLQGFYPRQFYLPFEEENFALCFACHDRNAFLYERTTGATNFRDRDYNLHYFHVNRTDKGRNCKSCHGVHGADQGKLLPSRVPGFGKWGIPMRWESTYNGATCYVGCHAPKTYNRVERFNPIHMNAEQ